MKYELHPLCTLFPRLSGDRIDALVGDIAAKRAAREPIVLHDGMIIDGGNRAAACYAAGVEPRYVEFAGGNPRCVCSVRQLASAAPFPGQAAAICGECSGLGEGAAGVPFRKRVPRGNLYQPLQRSAQSGASERTQQRAKVAGGRSRTGKQVAHGEVSLPAAVAKVEGRGKRRTQARHGQRRTRRRVACRECRFRGANRRDRARRAGGDRRQQQPDGSDFRGRRPAGGSDGGDQATPRMVVSLQKACLPERSGTRNEAIRIGEVLQGKARKGGA